jgi:hypothetical protein
LRHTVRRTAALALAAFGLALLLPAVAIAQDTKADPLPEPGTELAPGRYLSSVVGPTVDFRVGDGWVAGPSGGGPIFTLEYADAPGAVLSVTRFDGDTFLDSCDPSSLTVVDPSAERLAEIIAGNPFVAAGPIEPIEVDGFEGRWFDVGVPTYDPSECALPYLLLWAIPIGDGGESFPGVPFGAFLEDSMELVRSLRITPGEYIPPPTENPSPAASPAAPDASSPRSDDRPDGETA